MDLICKSSSLISLRQEIGDCSKCSLAAARKFIVFGEGSLTSPVMFIGEGPGEEEDKQGRPFVGRSGELLNKGIAEAGWSREDVYITNIVMCRPPGNRDPLPEEQNACSPYLDKKIDILKPRVLVALGRVAGQYLLKREMKITREHGQKFPFPGRPEIFIIPVYHPAYVLRNRSEKVVQEFYQDIKTAKNIALGG